MNTEPTKQILDACCGGRMMWFDPPHLVQAGPRSYMAHMGKQGRQSDHLRSAKIAATKRASGQAKLTEQQVREIRASQKTNRQLSAEYGINPSRINGIRLGRMWKDFSNPFAGLMRAAQP